jgi:membrane peptidoglycan carboxypeptidase
VGLNATENSDAWMVGYTPSLSAAVWVGNDNPNVPIENAEGAIVYGAGLPGAVWQQFMDTVLAGTPEEELPDRAVIRGDTGEGVAEPRTESQAAPSSSPPTRSAPEPEPEPETPAPAPSIPTETVTDPPAGTVPEVGTGQVGGRPTPETEDTTLGGQEGGDGDERAEGEPAPEPAPETEAPTQPEPQPVG